jgi:predicted RNA methylase
MLTCACALAGAPYVLGVDIDTSSLLIALENASQFEGLPVDFLHADVHELPLCMANMEASSPLQSLANVEALFAPQKLANEDRLSPHQGEYAASPTGTSQEASQASLPCSADVNHLVGSHQRDSQCNGAIGHQTFCMSDIRQENVDHWTRRRFDFAVCNPPFGTWVKGADTAFLAAAFQVRAAFFFSTWNSLLCDVLVGAAMYSQ